MRTVWLSAIGAAAIVCSGLQAQTQDELDKRFGEAWAKQPRVNLGIPAGTAKVVIVKFNDWMCPGCKIWYQQLKPVLAKYPAGAIKYVEKDFPWNAQCNTSIQQTIPGHESACAAAVAVRLPRRRASAGMAGGNTNRRDAGPAWDDGGSLRASGRNAADQGLRRAYNVKIADSRGRLRRSRCRCGPRRATSSTASARPGRWRMIPVHYVEVALQHELAKK
jgi:hypothetical protein